MGQKHRLNGKDEGKRQRSTRVISLCFLVYLEVSRQPWIPAAFTAVIGYALTL